MPYIVFLVLYGWFGVGLVSGILFMDTEEKYLICAIMLMFWLTGLIYLRAEFFSAYLG